MPQPPPAEQEFDPLKLLHTVPPEELWSRYFETPRAGEEVRRIVQRLHRDKQHAHVIAALRAALLAGQPEPWMYEVLALSMEIQGAPKKEVERILLSAIDFNALDVGNLLGSAAYLVRLGAPAQALKLYRQVSQLEPSRPEPYLLGSKLADKLKDVDAIVWSCTGVLTYYWFDDYQKQHQDAIGLLRSWQLNLEKGGETERAHELELALKQALWRDLQIRLVWSGEADLDLIVHEPLGTVCSFADRYTQSGGALLHEGAGPNQANCYEEYVCAYAAAGYYVVHVEHVSGKIVGNRARLEVTRYAGREHEQKDVIPIVFDERVKKYRISLHQGRRTEKTPVFTPLPQSTSARKRQTQQTLAQLRHEMVQSKPWLNQLRQNPVGAVGYTPQVATVSSGVNLTAQATISADRRYVRIGLQPTLTQVTDVFTFSFAGSR